MALGSGRRRSDGWQLTTSSMDPELCIRIAGRAPSGHCEEDGSTYEARCPRPTTEGEREDGCPVIMTRRGPVRPWVKILTACQKFL